MRRQEEGGEQDQENNFTCEGTAKGGIKQSAMNELLAAKWERFKKLYLHCEELGLSLDVSRMDFDETFLESMEPAIQRAFGEMRDLERGAIANKDENRMVGHYWLRNAHLAPTEEIRKAILTTIEKIRKFAAAVIAGSINGAGGNFENLLVIGIGGSALGPQFVSKALVDNKKSKLKLFFIDNTDPDGIDAVLTQLDVALSKTLTLVISKSGGTKETRNGMLEVKRGYELKGLRFGAHAVAVTGEGSELEKASISGEWLERFPMWDWVGGRTSELSAVGLLPAALQGIDIDGLLSGAAACDQITRKDETMENPSALMALMWYFAGNGKGTKDLVILPYRDRLELFSKYLQQLIMESIGKELDRSGSRTNQGLAVYGNKGSTDQHAYVQQLRDGINNFFVTFINVLKDRSEASIEVEPGVATGDYLNGFFMGTRKALHENSRQSITISIMALDVFRVGALIALFERTVGFYASLVNINAYHQPGVEAGKKAAQGILDLQAKVVQHLITNLGVALSVADIAKGIGDGVDPEEVYYICEHLAGSQRNGVRRKTGEPFLSSTYSIT